MTAFSSQQAVDLAKVRRYLLTDTARLAVDRMQVSAILQELCRHLFHRQHMVHQTRCDGAPKDRVVFGGFKGLCHGHPAVFFDRPQAERAVRASARQHDAHGVFAAVFRQGTEEAIDWRAVAARLNWRRHSQPAVFNGQRGVRRDDVDAVGCNLNGIAGLLDSHIRASRQQLRQGACMIGGKVLDDDKRDTGIGRHVFEEFFKRLQTACGSAQCRDQELVRVRFALAHLLPPAGRALHRT